MPQKTATYNTLKDQRLNAVVEGAVFAFNPVDFEEAIL
jgi:hypothetical protein